MSTTYYMGAGASARALPCVANLSQEIRKVFGFINGNRPNGYSFFTRLADNFGEIQSIQDAEILDQWSKLYDIEKSFLEKLDITLSIDTMARIFFINEDFPNYNQLKAILIASFLIWERKNGVDNRYENFWATIAQTNQLSSIYRAGRKSE